MTAYMIFIALVIAAALGVWLVSRSRKEPPGTSGVDPDAIHDDPETPRERGEGDAPLTR